MRSISLCNLLSMVSLTFRDCLGMWHRAFDHAKDLSEMSESYLLARDRSIAVEQLRTWRMRVFQLRGPSMQADLFKQRSQRLKLRLMLRIWKDRLKSKSADNDTDSLSSLAASDRAHTAPITPRRSTRRYLWRNTYSR
jgi:hypothetical protein